MQNLIFPLSPKEAERMGVKYSSQDNKEALFPTRLRELRKKKNISQATLAKELSLTKSTIGLYETGDNVPDIKTLAAMAQYFGVSADYMLGLAKDSTFDIEIRAISEKTGLSENSINRLMNINTVKYADIVQNPDETVITSMIKYNQINFVNDLLEDLQILINIVLSINAIIYGDTRVSSLNEKELMEAGRYWYCENNLTEFIKRIVRREKSKNDGKK